MMVFMIIAFPMVEIAGRRTLIFWGSNGLCAMSLVMGISGCFHTKGPQWVFLVGIFLWGIVFQLCMGAVPFSFGAEIVSLPLRATVISLMAFVQKAV